jgi:hypothetical protein
MPEPSSKVTGFDTRDLHVKVYGISQSSLSGKMDGGGRKWGRGLKDLMRWITRGHDHIYGDLVSGGLIPEGEGTLAEEVAQIERRIDEHGVVTIESVETGWSFLQGLGSPVEISLGGPNPIHMEFDLGDYLTRALDTLGALNKWCMHCGGRFTVICPDCTTGACWFICVRHKTCLCCEICERETNIFGD